jgi:predicted lipid-binding transport protein (Tim44 family)
MKKWIALLTMAVAFVYMPADAAKRLGGGKSMGQQSNHVTQREAAKPAAPNTAPNATPNAAPNATPNTTQSAAPNAAPAATPHTATPAPSRPWAGMLGGLAAGLGLAWLAHSMGFGAEFGQFLMFGLLALVIMMVFGMLMRRRVAPATDNNSPYAFEGAHGTGEIHTPTQYNPKNVGNDASARPHDTDPAYQPAPPRSGAIIGSALAGDQTWGVPAGFDTQGFINAAKQNFMLLQRAWDASDIVTLRTMMTDAMVEEIKTQLAEREANSSGQPNQTDVVMLEAKMLGIEELPTYYMASVEFSGLIREEPTSGPTPFREVWNMSKPKDGSMGWLVAGVQALQ